MGGIPGHGDAGQEPIDSYKLLAAKYKLAQSRRDTVHAVSRALSIALDVGLYTTCSLALAFALAICTPLHTHTHEWMTAHVWECAFAAAVGPAIATACWLAGTVCQLSLIHI